MFVLNCYITIGNVKMNSVHDVRISRSMHTYVDTCKIKLPASARLKFSGPKATESIIQSDEIQQTATLFNVGDKVIVQLGYDNDLRDEFKGFVKRVNFANPLEIECEGYSWVLKRITITKSWQTTTLKQILQYIIQGTEIKLSPDIPDVPLNNVFFRNVSADQVLDWIEKKLLMGCFFNFDQLYAGLEFTQYKGTVKYKLGWNTIKDDKLKYHLAADTKIKIKAIYIKNDGTRLRAEVGDSEGSTRTAYFTNISSLNDLKNAAEKKIKEFKYDGYEGKISTFLQPYSEHGYKAVVTDDQYPERSGNYILESIEVEFGSGGARRLCELGIKIS